MSSLLRILIVDDSPNLRKVIKSFLKTHAELGTQLLFHEAGDGALAETVLQEQRAIDEPIDVIFLDWMMPRMTGLDFLKKIREVDSFKTSPSIVMLTAETYSENINACIKYGVSVYLTKPFTQTDVCAALDQCLKKRGLVDHAI